MIDYTYTVEEFNDTSMTMRVRYKSAGKVDHIAIMPVEIYPEKTLQESIDLQIKSAVPIYLWKAQEASLTPEDVSTALAKQNIPAQAVVPTDDRTDTQKALDKAANERSAKEGIGVTWTAPNGDTIYLDTTQASQSRFSAATTAIANNLRTDPSKWKCAKITASGPELIFRDTTNAELLAWAGLVLGHVQKCFDAEAATVAKILSGDLTADFETEFNLL